MTLEAIERYAIENLGFEDDCPCCCHNKEEVGCVRGHGEVGCCVVSEYPDLDRCCYSSDS